MSSDPSRPRKTGSTPPTSEPRKPDLSKVRRPGLYTDIQRSEEPKRAAKTVVRPKPVRAEPKIAEKPAPASKPQAGMESRTEPELQSRRSTPEPIADMNPTPPKTPSAPPSYRDLVTSHLREDTRIRASVLANRRVYTSELYEVYLCIYSGLVGSKALGEDLVTCLVVFKQERIRLMFRLWTAEIRGSRSQYIEKAVERLTQEGTSPLHLVRDAKEWGKLPLTEQDHEAFRNAGL